MADTLVKMCGITNLQDAENAVEAGADALGFVFYQKSPRYISFDSVENISRKLPARIIKIGVFVNESRETLENLSKKSFLDYFQFSGDENAADCSGYDTKIIKAFRIGREFDFTELNKLNDCEVFLFDKARKGEYGGTGETYDWDLLQSVKTVKPVIIAGGLNPGNVADLVSRFRPFMVDVSSGIEAAPGRKDQELMRRFVEECRKADNNLEI